MLIVEFFTVVTLVNLKYLWRVFRFLLWFVIAIFGTNHKKGFWVTIAALAVGVDVIREACASKVRRTSIHTLYISSLRWIRLLPIPLELLPRIDRYPILGDSFIGIVFCYNL